MRYLNGAEYIELADGLVTLPSLAFLGDIDSGLYRIGADNIGISLGGALEYDFSATGLNLKANILYGDSVSGGTLTLTSTSHSTKGNISLGRLTLSDLANSTGIVFGDLDTATRGIDLSGSGLSGTDDQIYLGSIDHWQADGTLYASSIYSGGGIYIGGSVNLGLTYGSSAVSLFGNITGYNLKLTANQEIISTLETTSSHLFGNSTRVGSLTAVTVSGSDLQHADIDTSTAVGDLVHIISGTGVTPGYYRITVVGANSVTVDRAPGGTGTNIVLTIYKDVISMHATDATNGQMLTSWSAQNKPLQLGGTVLAATATLTSKDLYIGGNIGFSGETANGTVATTITSLGPTGTATTIQGWIKIIDSGGTARYIPYW